MCFISLWQCCLEETRQYLFCFQNPINGFHFFMSFVSKTSTRYLMEKKPRVSFSSRSPSRHDQISLLSYTFRKVISLTRCSTFKGLRSVEVTRADSFLPLSVTCLCTLKTKVTCTANSTTARTVSALQKRLRNWQ